MIAARAGNEDSARSIASVSPARRGDPEVIASGEREEEPAVLGHVGHAGASPAYDLAPRNPPLAACVGRAEELDLPVETWQ